MEGFSVIQIIIYNSFQHPNIPFYLYGTHYSGIGPTLHFLIRTEPFASLNISL